MKKKFNKMIAKSLVALLLATLLLSCSNSQKSKTVTIGDQVWMAENLNVDKFRNGDPIPQAQTDEEWQQAGENEQPAWCYYENDPANGKIYGKLYNGYAVNDWRGLAPEGWRIPSDKDWEKLIEMLGGEDVAGSKLKATDTWLLPISGATNESGFTALPGGGRKINGTFLSIGSFGVWWSAPDDGTNRFRTRMMFNDDGEVAKSSKAKEFGFSVRCLRD